MKSTTHVNITGYIMVIGGYLTWWLEDPVSITPNRLLATPMIIGGIIIWIILDLHKNSKPSL